MDALSGSVRTAWPWREHGSCSAGGVRDLEGASNTVRAPEGGEQARGPPPGRPKRRAARLGREHHGTGRPPFTLIVSPIT